MIAGIVAGLVGKIVDGLAGYFKDKAEIAKAKIEIERIVAEHLREVDVGQIELNKEEAKHASLFVAGWRPFVGWMCACGVAYAWIVRPLAQDLLLAFGVLEFALPDLDVEGLLTMLGALLGVAGLRTYEKVKGLTK